MTQVQAASRLPIRLLPVVGSPTPSPEQTLRADALLKSRQLPFMAEQGVNVQLFFAAAAATFLLVGMAMLLAAPLVIRRLIVWLSF